MRFSAIPHPLCLMLLASGAMAVFAAPALAQSAPALPERGVFITQIGESSRAEVTQQNPDRIARIAQNGDGNQINLAQNGAASHRAQIAQDGDGNIVAAQQNGDGRADLALVQEGNSNIATLRQRELSAAGETSAAVFQRGNDNTVVLEQDGSDNSAALDQQGNGNTMTATQQNSGNRLEWSQTGDGLSDLQIVQTGNGGLQITQSTTGAQFAPPPGSGG